MKFPPATLVEDQIWHMAVHDLRWVLEQNEEHDGQRDESDREAPERDPAPDV